MTKEMIINAYCRIRTIDNTIPDDVLDFMKESALDALTKQTGTNPHVMGRSELLKSFYQFLDSKGLINANKDYSDEWVKEYEKTI